MVTLYNIALEAGTAGLFLIPLFLIWNHIRFHSLKSTLLYFLFSVYLCSIYTVVGLPNVSYIRFEPNIQLIPGVQLLSNLSDTLLNVLLFLPLGISLPLLWKKYRHISSAALLGFCLSLSIEFLQMFTFRATDVNDLITNTLGTILGYCSAVPIFRRIPALHCRANDSDFPLLLCSCASVMFLLQPVIWLLIY